MSGDYTLEITFTEEELKDIYYHKFLPNVIYTNYNTRYLYINIHP